MSGTLLDQTEWVKFKTTPIPVPLKFSPGGFYRICAKVECRACGRWNKQYVRSPRYMRDRNGDVLRDPMGRRITLPPPDPSAYETVSKLLLCATEHMVGCFDNPVTDLGFVSDKARPGRHHQIGKCGLNGHKTCICGYVWTIHKKGCPTAMVPRVSRMVVAGMSSSVQLMSVRGRA